MLDLDGTANKAKLGANAILGVSLAVAKAAAESAGLPLFRYLGGPNAHVLPVPMMNILNGGAHADSNVDIQEFMIAPIGAPTFREALRWGAEVYHALKTVLKEQGPVHRPRRRGRLRPEPRRRNRGRARPDRRGDREGRASRPGSDIALALDVAASEFYTRRRLRLRGQARSPPSEMIDYYAELRRRPTRSSPSRTRWPRTTGTAGTTLTEQLGDKVQIVGDDLFVTNPERLRPRHRRAAPPTRSWSRSTRSAR